MTATTSEQQDRSIPSCEMHNDTNCARGFEGAEESKRSSVTRIRAITPHAAAISIRYFRVKRRPSL